MLFLMGLKESFTHTRRSVALLQTFISGNILFVSLKTPDFCTANRAPHPWDANICLNNEDGDILTNPIQYCSLIRRLVYLTIIRPNITFAIHKLSKFLGHPRIPHFNAASKALCYLKSTSQAIQHFTNGSNTLKLIVISSRTKFAWDT